MNYKMDIDSETSQYLNMQEDSMIYDDPYQNFCRLKMTEIFLKTGEAPTEAWVNEHKGHIQKYGEIFPRMSLSNQEIDSEEFRTKASQSETILKYLLDCIEKSNTFDLKWYSILNSHMIYMCEVLFSEDDMNECMENMKKLNITG